MDDVENLVRTALRDNAALITQDSLRNTSPPTARQPKTRSTVLVAAAFVLAVGGITTAVTLRGNDGLGQLWGTRVEGPAYVGFRWNMLKADGYEVPADLGASMSFFRTGDFRMRDGVNTMFGRHDAAATSVRLRDIGRTSALYTGSDPMRRAVIDAMDELSLQEARVSITGDRLVITTNTHEMILTRGEPVTGPGSPMNSGVRSR